LTAAARAFLDKSGLLDSIAVVIKTAIPPMSGEEIGVAGENVFVFVVAISIVADGACGLTTGFDGSFRISITIAICIAVKREASSTFVDLAIAVVVFSITDLDAGLLKRLTDELAGVADIQPGGTDPRSSGVAGLRLLWEILIDKAIAIIIKIVADFAYRRDLTETGGPGTIALTGLRSRFAGPFSSGSSRTTVTGTFGAGDTLVVAFVIDDTVTIVVDAVTNAFNRFILRVVSFVVCHGAIQPSLRSTTTLFGSCTDTQREVAGGRSQVVIDGTVTVIISVVADFFSGKEIALTDRPCSLWQAGLVANFAESFATPLPVDLCAGSLSCGITIADTAGNTLLATVVNDAIAVIIQFVAEFDGWFDCADTTAPFAGGEAGLSSFFAGSFAAIGGGAVIAGACLSGLTGLTGFVDLSITIVVLAITKLWCRQCLSGTGRPEASFTNLLSGCAQADTCGSRRSGVAGSS
jgi:hypothetical protein